MRVRPQAVEELSKLYINAPLPPHKRNAKIPPQVFKSYFFLYPDGVADLWEEIKLVIDNYDEEYAASATFKHLLYALYFYKTYDTSEKSARFFGVCKKTYSNHVWKMTCVLQLVYDEEVRQIEQLFFILILIYISPSHILSQDSTLQPFP